MLKKTQAEICSAVPTPSAAGNLRASTLLALIIVAVLLPAVAHAQVVTGGTNPTTIINNIASFILGPFGEGVAALAVAAVGIMCWTGRMGFHAIGWLVGGLVLMFGSSYLVTTFVGGG